MRVVITKKVKFQSGPFGYCHPAFFYGIPEEKQKQRSTRLIAGGANYLSVQFCFAVKIYK
jgi:hypothetical protein